MKHQGCILDFTDQRNEEIMKAYRNAIASLPFIEISEVARIVVDTPCSRFWVSEERATVVVSAILKGKPVLDGMRELKREMFMEIYNRAIPLIQEREGDTLYNIVFDVVNSPSPKFYLQPLCAMDIIYKIKSGFYERQRQNRYHGS